MKDQHTRNPGRTADLTVTVIWAVPVLPAGSGARPGAACLGAAGAAGYVGYGYVKVKHMGCCHGR